MNPEAVKRYHESRRRKVNDNKPERQEQIARNKHSTKRYQRKKQVCASMNYATLIVRFKFSCKPAEKKW